MWAPTEGRPWYHSSEEEGRGCIPQQPPDATTALGGPKRLGCTLCAGFMPNGELRSPRLRPSETARSRGEGSLGRTPSQSARGSATCHAFA